MLANDHGKERKAEIDCGAARASAQEGRAATRARDAKRDLGRRHCRVRRARIRAIADRLGLLHPLITYHYRSKDILWRAAAEHAFAQIGEGWDTLAPENADLPPLARLREEYATLFRYTVGFPEFHRFMRQEAFTNSPRLKWVAESVVTPLLGRLIPQIVAAQKQGLLPAVDPILYHYMMVSLTATLSAFGPEMQVTSGLSAENTKVIEAYWGLVDETVFGKHARGKPALV